MTDIEGTLKELASRASRLIEHSQRGVARAKETGESNDDMARVVEDVGRAMKALEDDAKGISAAAS
jgi:methyl-accepting chemotaxis protein